MTAHVSFVLFLLASALTAGEVRLIGAKPSEVPVLAETVSRSGHALVMAETPGPGLNLVVAGDKGAEILSPLLEDQLRHGASLLLAMPDAPQAGWGSLRYASFLPTTLWAAAEKRLGPARVAESSGGWLLPFIFDIRPWHAAERGQSRYDCYTRPVPWIRYTNPNARNPTIGPGTRFWSRPLLNREWQVHSRADNSAGSPVVITGRYGAGKTAVFASSFTSIPNEESSIRYFSSLLGELSPVGRMEEPAMPAFGPPQVIPAADGKSVRLEWRNPLDVAASVEVSARLMTWEPAIIENMGARLELGPKATGHVDLPLPERSRQTHEALDFRDEFLLRVAILTPLQTRLAGEWEIPIDRRPPLRLEIRTPEERQRDYPFQSALPGKELRLGQRADAYAYLPGALATATITLTNGLRNVAALASVSDPGRPDNPSLGAIADGGAIAERKPDWFATDAWGYAEVASGGALTFSFPTDTLLAGVTLVGSPDAFRNYRENNPRTVLIEVDGTVVARLDEAMTRFSRDAGRVALPFEPVRGRELKLRFPKLKGDPNLPLRLAEVEIDGWTGPSPPAISGTLGAELVDDFTGTRLKLAARPVKLPSHGRESFPIEVEIPAGEKTNLLRVDASFEGVSASHPLLSVSPVRPLVPIEAVKPLDAIDLGFIVTRGFRNFFHTGTGTAEDSGGWSRPDDLVWAYSRGMKQLGRNSKMEPGTLYLSENDLRHYSTPWRQFADGSEFFSVAAPMLVEKLRSHKNWSTSNHVVLSFSDRWDAGPEVSSMNSWQDFEGFHGWLVSRGLPGLEGMTKQDLVGEIGGMSGFWHLWHHERYQSSLRALEDAFSREGKKLTITAQGMPIIPGESGETTGRIVRGVSDDSTWGMHEDDVPLTTARQMAALAFNPYLEMATQNAWGYDSMSLGNREWRGVTSTTEASRRHLYDRAFRGTVRPDGQYSSMHTFGFRSNAGMSYRLNEADIAAWHRVQEKHALLTPDAPLGAGVVLSTSHLEDPRNFTFDVGSAYGVKEARLAGHAIRRLHHAGFPVSFSANLDCLAKWESDLPLIFVNPADWTAEDLSIVEGLASRGVRAAAFLPPGRQLPPAAAAFFGTDADGLPLAAERAASHHGKAVVRRGAFLLLPADPETWSDQDALGLLPLLHEHLAPGIRFPVGTAGYGFRTHGRTAVVVEDWREQGRVADILLTGYRGRVPRAVCADSHRRLAVTAEDDKVTVRVPLRPGDATLILLE